METIVSLFGVQPLRIGGIEFFTKELARQLAPHGWQSVAVFSSAPPPRVSEFLTAPNLVLEVVPELEYSPFKAVPGVAAVLRRYRPRIAHLHFVNFLSPLPWVARLLGVRQVFFTAHGSNPTGYVPRRAALWKRCAARLINLPMSRVVCVSEYVRRSFLAVDLLPGERFVCVYDAIAVPALDDQERQRESFRRRLGVSGDCDLVVQASWIIPEKGVPDLLAAAQLVLARRPHTRFAFVGSGDYLESYRREADRLGVAQAVTFTGLVENPMSEGVYAAADVCCLASRWEEAFGWVLAEAMGFEKPVVATRVGGIPEVVEDGRTGFLVPGGDAPALADRILRLLEDAPLRRRLGQAGRKAVEERFGLERNVHALLGHYGLHSSFR
jgi:glycosyltransferase involved in cell wall biosynthesis